MLFRISLGFIRVGRAIVDGKIPLHCIRNHRVTTKLMYSIQKLFLQFFQFPFVNTYSPRYTNKMG